MGERTMSDEQHQTVKAAVAVLKKNAPNISTAGLFEVATGLVKRGAVAVDVNGVAYLHDAEKAGRHYQWAQDILATKGATSAEYAPAPLESYADPLERSIEQLKRIGVDPNCLSYNDETSEMLAGAETAGGAHGDPMARTLADYARLGIDAGVL